MHIKVAKINITDKRCDAKYMNHPKIIGRRGINHPFLLTMKGTPPVTTSAH